MKHSRSFFIGLLLIIMLVPILSLVGCTDSNASTWWMFGALTPFLFFLIVPIIIIVLIILLIWWLIKKSKEQSPRQNKDDKYLDIAKERYAKGEITHEQFEQIKKEFS